METKEMVPRLRFSVFEKSFENVLLFSISNRIGDGIHSTPNYSSDGQYYFINGNNLNNGVIDVNESTKKIDEIEYLKHNKPLVEGTLLMSINGTIGNLAFYNSEKILLGKSACYIELSNKVSKVYIYYQLQSERIKRFYYSQLTGSTIMNLSLKSIRSTPIVLLSTEEQQKIALFLSSVDEKISQLEKKKTLLETYKRGIMQKIFSQELRFKDENGEEFPEWEDFILNDIGETYQGLTGKTKENFGEGKLYIQYMQIFSKNIIDISQCGRVQINEGEKQSKVQYGDVLFTTSSETPEEVGYPSVFLDSNREVYLNSFSFGFRPKDDQILHPMFSVFLFRSQVFRKSIVKLAQGSTRYNMSKKQMLKLIISVPVLKEQQKIASLLSSIDKKIEITLTQLEKTRKFKKGLLQQMFV